MARRFPWIDISGPGRIKTMPRPPGGESLDAAIAALHAEGVRVIVSMLEDDEIELFDLEDEGAACERYGIDFLRHPIPDHSLPVDHDATRWFVDRLHDRYAAGASIAMHCFAGIGRATLIGASVLVRAGHDLDMVLERISSARGVSVPDTEAQLEWLRTYARDLTG